MTIRSAALRGLQGPLPGAGDILPENCGRRKHQHTESLESHMEEMTRDVISC